MQSVPREPRVDVVLEARGFEENPAARRRRENVEGALEVLLPFLDDEEIVEVLLNEDGFVRVEQRRQPIKKTGIRIDPSEAERMLRFIAVAAQKGKELNDATPELACKLPAPWFHRVQGLIPPWVDAPIFAMRAPARRIFPLSSYVDNNVLTTRQADALQRLVLDRRNVVVSGGTGTGKTTFLNALLQVIAEHSSDRVILIEDEQELQCASDENVRLHVEPPQRTIQQAVKHAMRLRPDRIIVGEVRDKSARDMLKAWRTDHSGIASVHADSCSGTLDRLTDLIEEDGPPVNRAAVAASVHVIVHLARDHRSPAGLAVTGIEQVKGWRADAGWQLEPLLVTDVS